jgi:hypothetical protein
MAMDVNFQLTGLPASLMRLHIVLPSQHFAPQRKQAPEQRLMIAVLRDAVDCVEKHRCTTDRQCRRRFREEVEWFLSEDTDWPYSFECICEALGLDASAVRHSLRLTPARPPLPTRTPSSISTTPTGTSPPVSGAAPPTPTPVLGPPTPSSTPVLGTPTPRSVESATETATAA